MPQQALRLLSNYTDLDDLRYSEEVMNGVLADRIDLDKRFNLKAYNHVIDEHMELRKTDRPDKYGISTEENLKNVKQTKGKNCTMYLKSLNDINSAVHVQGLKSAFEKLEDDIVLKSTIKKIKELNSDIIYFEHIDLIQTIKAALQGMKESVELLKQMCNKYKQVSDYVKIILQSGEPFEDLLGVA